MQLIDRAEQAGWCSQEVLDALSRLARLAAEQEAQAPLARRRYA